jgi:hypothetical protein
MTTPTEWAIGAVLGLTVSFAVYRALGPVRARDPMLSIGCTFVALRGVIAVGQLVERGTLDAPWALAAIVVAFLVRRRLRLFERAPTGNLVA